MKKIKLIKLLSLFLLSLFLLDCDSKIKELHVTYRDPVTSYVGCRALKDFRPSNDDIRRVIVTNDKYFNQIEKVLNEIRNDNKKPKMSPMKDYRFYIEVIYENIDKKDEICLESIRGLIFNGNHAYDNNKLRELIIETIDYTYVQRLTGFPLEGVKEVFHDKK